MKKWIILIVIIAALLAVAAVNRVNQLKNQPVVKGIDVIQAENGVPVRVYEVRTETVEQTIAISGTMEPIQSAMVASKIADRISKIAVTTGQAVKKDQVLVTLDTVTSELQVRQADENLLQARQMLDKLRNGSRPEEISAAQAQMKLAQADMEIKKLESQRQEKLYADQATTLQMAQQTQAAYQAAQAAHESAVAACELTVKGARAEDIALAEIAVQQAQTALEQARDRLNNHYLKAPFDGVVSRKLMDEGDIADFNEPVFQVLDTRKVYFDADITELYISRVKLGMAVRVRVDALPDETLTGAITEINPLSSGSNRSYMTRIEVDNADGKLMQGMFARAEFVINRLENIILLPDDCIRQSDAGSYVLTVNDQQVVEKVDVKTGVAIQNRTQIVSGLAPGLRVVAMALNVKPGDKVTVTE